LLRFLIEGGDQRRDTFGDLDSLKRRDYLISLTLVAAQPLRVLNPREQRTDNFGIVRTQPAEQILRGRGAHRFVITFDELGHLVHVLLIRRVVHYRRQSGVGRTSHAKVSQRFVGEQRVVPLVPAFPFLFFYECIEREIAHTGLTQLHVVESMHERKALMAAFADAFLAMPGGM